ncbi:energy-coupling factor transporter transmembrane component T [Pseudoramibacter faecis]|uniref:energy-coupling factor transporter transmembrane component T family protein n=1 Tax=Pseudoramibacter faecis TaxID=3108534 RepID=UPI002E770C97|nr:energy-coupling factor transporter transmembrane component T [Pseudoramibacter sp. HA2172]
MKKVSLAVITKIWGFFCVLTAASLGKDVILSCILTITACLCLAAQGKLKIIFNYGIFYMLLGLLLYAIQHRGLHMVIFSEFYVLMLWNLSPVILVSWDLITTPPGKVSAFLSGIHLPTSAILGVLVVFRFFPTMKSELRSVCLSMKSRNLTGMKRILKAPARSCEYVLIPLLIRILMIADQLSVSAIARGGESPGIRSSYYESRIEITDISVMILWAASALGYLWIGGIRI